MMKTPLLAVVLVAGMLGGCANTGPKETVGGLGGAALGGLLGAQIGQGAGNLAATAVGVVIGGILGTQLGQSLDKADQMYAQQAAAQAYNAPVGQTITWNNPNTGNSGSYTTTKTGTTASGLACREFQQTITVGGKREQAYGTACKQPDGAWKIVN